ncbi:MAG: TetR/AcrR family transcriptional regulator [Acidimicrobiales bacterium]
MVLPGTARTRLLDAATDLFYSEGITATGIDRIVAQSGVSKPTLYAHFHSKDELLAAVLEQRHSERVAALEKWMRDHSGSPRERLLAVFDWLASWHAGDGRRGCAFVNAAAEVTGAAHPARDVAQRHKRWMREYLADLATQAGLFDPERMGSDLMLLVDGANARMLVDGDRTAAADAKRLATVLIDAAGNGR